ncbi:putative FBD-associated F-box protein At5g56700 [Lotus japonicus]|uniref:putative FBD-associated F-box protein At5g56700 n=1 Tax=Lotus japonicus TaxID=34305 RepID=UPI00258E1621|nr:putative FBD-associated F-box protein At5g56700 [Lotus japonicus]
MAPIRRSRRLEGKRDRLSDLSDEILLHIMSFMMIKDVVKTCILSKRWQNLWKSLPDLILHVSNFSNPLFFYEFVSGLVRCRGGIQPLRTLDFDRYGYVQPQILNDLFQYALLHDLQHLKINVPYNFGLPNSIFSFQSLTSLHISVSPYDIKKKTRVPLHLDLPELVNLHLEKVGISTDENGHAKPFSTCNKLKILSIEDCVLVYPSSLSPQELGVLDITNATLTDLTIIDDTPPTYITAVPIPRYKYVICTPKLSSFTMNSSPFRTLHGQGGMTVELHSSSLM